MDRALEGGEESRMRDRGLCFLVGGWWYCEGGSYLGQVLIGQQSEGRGVCGNVGPQKGSSMRGGRSLWGRLRVPPEEQCAGWGLSRSMLEAHRE